MWRLGLLHSNIAKKSVKTYAVNLVHLTSSNRKIYFLKRCYQHYLDQHDVLFFAFFISYCIFIQIYFCWWFQSIHLSSLRKYSNKNWIKRIVFIYGYGRGVHLLLIHTSQLRNRFQFFNWNFCLDIMQDDKNWRKELVLLF